MEEELPAMKWVVVPWKEIPQATLASLIESFVLREGTDYGAEEAQFSSKIERVKRQLEQGTILIVYDSEEDSVTILTEHDLSRRK